MNRAGGAPPVDAPPPASVLLRGEGAVGEAFEELAERFLGLGPVPGGVVVTGPEPGAGRTTVCVGLGAALARAGKSVAVVDCNLDRPRLHGFFGRPNFTGLTSALEGGGDLEGYGFDAGEGVLGMRVIPTGPVPTGSAALARSPRLLNGVRGLAEGRDVVLLDAPVVGTILARTQLWGRFGGLLLVVHATRTPKGVARAAADALLDARLNLLGVVLNGHV